MSSTSEVAETYKLMTDFKKSAKSARLENANSDGWSKHTPYHWYRFVGKEKMSYWPSTGLVMYKGKRMNINSKRVSELLK